MVSQAFSPSTPLVRSQCFARQVVYLVVEPKRDIGFVVIGFLVGVYLLYCGLALPRYFRRAYQKDHRFKEDFTAEISEQGTHVVTGFSDAQMKWNSFVRFLESKDIFMVFIAQSNFIVFPKRAFAPARSMNFGHYCDGMSRHKPKACHRGEIRR